MVNFSLFDDVCCLPPFQWVGGKRRLVAKLLPLMPEEFNDYYECFVGGGAMFFAQGEIYNKAYLSDINPHVINFYKVLRDDFDELITFSKDHAKKHNADYFYKMRKLLNTKDQVFNASVFLYLIKTCFNGFFRLDKQGDFITSIGDTSGEQDWDNLYRCHLRLQKADCKINSFLNVTPKENDFIFIDPPYDFEEKQSDIKYYKDRFSKANQITVRDYCRKLDSKGVLFMQANANTSFIREAYKDFKITPVSIQRLLRKERHWVYELIITNY